MPSAPSSSIASALNLGNCRIVISVASFTFRDYTAMRYRSHADMQTIIKRDAMERTIKLPDELLSEVEVTALSQGKTLDQWLEEAVRAQLEDRNWSDLLEYGQKTGRASGHKEKDVPEIVKRRRRIDAGRA